MIFGVVNPYREAMVTLRVLDANGREEHRDVIVDTGFDGGLSLPSETIFDLDLPWARRGRAILADGSETVFDTYEGTVEWEGHLRRIPVDEIDTDPLVGMALLYGSALNIQVVDGGTVRIEKLP